MSYCVTSYLLRKYGKSFACRNLLSIFKQYASETKRPTSVKVLASAVAAIPKTDNVATDETVPSVIGSKAQNDSLAENSKSVSSVTSNRTEEPIIFVNSINHFLVSPYSTSHHATEVFKDLPNKKQEFSSLKCQVLTKEHDNKVTLLNAVTPSDLEWHKQEIDLKLLLRHYMSLSKIRLTGLVVLTTAAGYCMADGPLDIATLIYALVGTALMSASANSINQFLEVPYDSQMARTKKRVLIRGLLTPCHAATFAIFTGTLGMTTLFLGTNPVTAALGFSNLLIYTSAYTPMKRYSIANTWVGSIVGAIPPVMGWAACTGTLTASGLLMGAILFSWQFPHFNALSWNLRPDYSRAGYRMMSVINPDLCRRTALRHSVAILAYCSLAPIVGLTTWTFAIDSLPLNCYFIYCAYNFYKNANSQTSRKLFRLSLIHLPFLMLLMLLGKKYRPSKTDASMKSR